MDTHDGPVTEAFPPMSVTVRLEDDIDLSRGDMLCRPRNRPEVAREIDAMVCWMSPVPAKAAQRYVLKHTTQTTHCALTEVVHEVNVNTLHRDESAEQLDLNHIGRVAIRTNVPLVFDAYRRNHSTGAFILIDPSTNDTVAAGTILGATDKAETDPVSGSAKTANTVWQSLTLSRKERVKALGWPGATLWLTGLPSAGKSTLAGEVERRLVAGWAPGLPARRRQPAPRPERRPRLRPGRAGRERAPHRPRRTAPGGRRERRAGVAGQPLRSRSRAGARSSRGRRDRLHRGVHGHTAAGVRSARPQGAVRPRTPR